MAPASSSCRSDADARSRRRRIEQIVAEEGQQVLGWRDVPTDDSACSVRVLCGGAADLRDSSSSPAPTVSADGDAPSSASCT